MEKPNINVELIKAVNLSKKLYTGDQDDPDDHERIIHKNGLCNVSQHTPRSQKIFIFRYSKLVDSSWLFTLSVFLAVLFASWFTFALLYFVICYTHGDLEPDHLPENQEANGYKPCIYDIRGFSSCFLFSMEAQHTLGYGIKAPTDACAEAIFVNSIHCIIGFVMQGFMAAVIFSKMTKPRLRSQTILFSKNAVICPKDGKLCFAFRLGDIRTRYIIAAQVRAFMVKTKRTEEDEKLLHAQMEMKMQTDGCADSVFFNWPIVMYHVIDENSPLYFISPSDLCHQRFEIMVIIEGVDENTGQVAQAKSSYVPKEILWGSRFVSLLKYDELREEYEVDFSKFDSLVPISTPLCSAAYTDDYIEMQKSKVSSHLRLDFTPRQSIGEIPSNIISKFQTNISIENDT
ncbi:ATP-sensitive inward rectifier potassium channel 1-like isoform X2 [Sitophilus oryzae]|uniref:ATP-sensitive inward rectifier potassium channel 1-like isoform X2 n=1 Tax=Sitophilus oryzae TaxID=7048 RepID=A0A6J2XKT5_SITOR|nr:ATP-sensitive inward rectifier potassium channel 1-like isoform X2 [Sitophilus oryzae]